MTEEETEPRSRARWLGVLLIVLALALLVWRAWLAGFADEAPAEAVPMGSVGKPSLQEMLARIDATRLAGEAVASAASAAAKPAMAPDEADVCGVGRVKIDESGQLKDMAPVQLAAQGAARPPAAAAARQQRRAAACRGAAAAKHLLLGPR